jgi:endonuclease-3
VNKKERVISVFDKLTQKYPNVGTFLTHNNPFELLIAVILSAQCTDKRVNQTTPDLFQRFRTPQQLYEAPLDDIRDSIKSINFFNTKALNIQKTAGIIDRKHKGKVPEQLAELIQLPGVGRKTANVVLGQAFGQPGITADTHVKRVSKRLGFTKEIDATKVEYELMKVWPKSIWTDFSSIMILHGRDTCNARKPKCDDCLLIDSCPQIM